MKRGPDISPLSLLLNRVDAVADGGVATNTVACGFPSLDRMLGGGFRLGDLIVLGGDVSSGKSALALAIALRVAMAGRRAALYSGEMTSDRIMERALAIEGRVRIDELRQGSLDDMARAQAGAAAIRLRDAMPRIDRIPVNGLNDLVESLDKRSKLELLVVDSIQALGKGERSEDDELSWAVGRLKALALDLNVAILATAQLSGVDSREDRRPQLGDFGVLGAVKHHADVVLGLYREEMYDPARSNQGATELFVRKNRNGNTGYVDLFFYSQWMRFEDMLEPDR
jgi:replicative DNA helicase